MKRIFYLFAIVLSINCAQAASFDCKKASTTHEKLICNTPELNDADTQLGNTYGLVLKNFKFPDLIRVDQRSWLYGYRNCGVLAKCIDMIKNRINELNKYQKASIYADYKENKFLITDGTIILFDESGLKTARFLGNWMPDGRMDPNKMKGYPFDGQACDEEYELLKKGNLYVSKNNSDEISLMIDDSKIIFKGRISCGSRTGFEE